MPGLNSPWDLPTDPLAALIAGDPAPFEAFVRSHAARFLGFFRRLGASPEEAEDLAQEVFLKLHQNAARYSPEERLASYSFRVARNVWIDSRRRRAARPNPSSLDAGDPEADEAFGDRLAGRSEDPGATVALRDIADRLRAAAGELGEHHRLVFELGVIQELSYPEISAVLDIPVGTVKSRMFHAVRRLRDAVPDGAAELDPTGGSSRGSQRTGSQRTGSQGREEAR